MKKSFIVFCIVFLFSLSIVTAYEDNFPVLKQNLKEQIFQELTDNLNNGNSNSIIFSQNFPRLRAVTTSIFISLIVISIIELILKGFAMWKAARKSQKVWFWCLLIFQTMGILPLIYLLIHLEPRKSRKS